MKCSRDAYNSLRLLHFYILLTECNIIFKEAIFNNSITIITAGILENPLKI